MKFLEKFALTVYSYIVLILAVIMCLLVFNWMDVRIVTQTISMITQGDISSKITLGVSAIFILLSIKCIFFDSETEEKIKESQGILLKNENGQLLITKETLDNMIKSVVYKFDNIENCTPRISIDEQNEISITLQVVVKDNVIIKDLANSLVEAKVLTGMYARLIKIGGHTGDIDLVMKQIADHYDQETNEKIHHLISIIEPTLVAILSIFVGIILLSVMLPLMGIMSSL